MNGWGMVKKTEIFSSDNSAVIEDSINLFQKFEKQKLFVINVSVFIAYCLEDHFFHSQLQCKFFFCLQPMSMQKQMENCKVQFTMLPSIMLLVH